VPDSTHEIQRLLRGVVVVCVVTRDMYPNAFSLKISERLCEMDRWKNGRFLGREKMDGLTSGVVPNMANSSPPILHLMTCCSFQTDSSTSSTSPSSLLSLAKILPCSRLGSRPRARHCALLSPSRSLATVSRATMKHPIPHPPSSNLAPYQTTRRASPLPAICPPN